LSQQGISQDLSVADIHHPSEQLRSNLDNVEELAESIKQHGLLQPIVVRPEKHKFEVVAGNRRLAAVRLLKLRKIVCHIIDLSDKEAYEVALVENVQHRTLNPIEEGTAFKRYVEIYGRGGFTELARRIGKSQEFVTKRTQLLSLPEKVQWEIIQQKISLSVALEMLPLDRDSVVSLADIAIKNNLSKKEVNRIVKISKRKRRSLNEMNKSKDSLDYQKQIDLLDKTLRKSITVMKSSLMYYDDIIRDMNDKWIVKELIMYYRQLVHGDIDTFLKLRKKFAMKIPLEYYRAQNTVDADEQSSDQKYEDFPNFTGSTTLM